MVCKALEHLQMQRSHTYKHMSKLSQFYFTKKVSDNCFKRKRETKESFCTWNKMYNKKKTSNTSKCLSRCKLYLFQQVAITSPAIPSLNTLKSGGSLFYSAFTSCTPWSLLCSWPHMSLPCHISWYVFTGNIYLLYRLYVSHAEIMLLKNSIVGFVTIFKYASTTHSKTSHFADFNKIIIMRILQQKSIPSINWERHYNRVKWNRAVSTKKVISL